MRAYLDNTVLGIDLGSSALKAAYLDAEGRPRAILPAGHIRLGLDPTLLEAGGPGRDGPALDPAVLGGHMIRWCRQSLMAGEWLPPAFAAVAARILAQYFEAVGRLAWRHLGRPVQQAVIAVPAGFGASAVEVVRRAAQMAGLPSPRCARTPVAVAAVYLDADPRDSLRILTYDLGAGSFDAAVLAKRGGQTALASCGGGRHPVTFDFDCALARWIVYRLAAEGQPLRLSFDDPTDQKAFADILGFAERVKVALSTRRRYRLVGTLVCARGAVEIDLGITRRQFEALIAPRIKETILQARRAAAAACAGGSPGDGEPELPLRLRRERGELDELLLLGGSSRIPLVGRLVAAEFGAPPRQVEAPEFLPALGAARLAGDPSQVAPCL